MSKRKIVKRIKVTVIALVMSVAAGYWSLSRPAAASEAAQGRGRVEFVAISTPMNERFGVDDGASLVVHFSSSIHGNLEPCG